MNNKDLCLQDIERCKAVQPIAERLGIEPDGYFRGLVFNYKSRVQEWEYCKSLPRDYTELVPTYRQDKLELALPDHVELYKKLAPGGEDRLAIADLYVARMENLWKLRGEPKRIATVDLIYLLDKEGLL